MKKLLLLFFSLFILAWQTAGQEKITITGQVTSVMEDDVSLPGVSVVVKNTNIGTITDQDGYYTIEASANDTLVFSYVGMAEEVIPIDGRSNIDVGMVMDIARLGEVVVVGYGTESSRLVSGSIGVVSEDDMRRSTLRTLDGVLQGKASGVQISQSSGTPGAAPSIRIRGSSSITAGNEPLYVIDGVPMITGNYGQVGFSGQGINALSDLNPADIESVTVLKDASAAAIYGARATNGVVLITTKRGKRDVTDINFNTSVGFQQLENRLEMLNAEQWHEYKGTEPDHDPPIDTDWLDEVLNPAPIANYELSVRGGVEDTRYYLSAGYFDQEGVVLGTSYERLNTRLNLDHRVNDNLEIGAGFGASYSLNKRVEGDASINAPLPMALSRPPIYPVYNQDGTYNDEGFYTNPVAVGKEAINEAHSYRTQGNAFLDYRFLRNFSFDSKISFDYLSLREHSYDPITTRQGARSNGIGIEGQNNVLNIVSNNLIRYVNTFADVHNLEALAGYSFEIYQRRTNYMRGVDFPNEDFQYIRDAATITTAYADALDRSINSYFGQVRYNYDYKYILSLSARMDGSSKFSEEHRYGFFPAGSIAWRLSEEDFFRDMLGFFDEFRLRASYGLTGNDGIPDYRYLSLYRGGYNYMGAAGIAPAQLPNPDLKWETTKQFNVGLNFAILDERVDLAVDYYNNQTEDLLISRPVSMTSGFSSILFNIGELENKGIEVTLKTVNFETSNFQWTSDLNISRNRNKVLSLYKDQPLDNLGRASNSVRVGEPIGIFYGYKSYGVDPSTGDIVFSQERMKIGDPNPDFTGGFTNNVFYGPFELSVFLQFSYGNDVYNGSLMYLEAMKGEDNQTTRILDRWREPGDETYMPRATESDPNHNNRISSRFIEDGSYLRVKNLTLAYNLDGRTSERLGLKNARIFVTGQNLLTFTNYTGMDPEVNYAGAATTIMGTDFFTFPQMRSFSIGINVGL